MTSLPSQAQVSALLSRPAWVFDMDGTLTVRVHDFQAFKEAQGLPLEQPILEALEDASPQLVARVDAALVTWEQELADEARPAPGAAELLARLQARGARLGVLTRNTADNALRTLGAAGLDHYFAASDVLGRDSAAPKPSPEGIHRLLAGWEVAPDAAVMVGDYLFDVQAGRAAGTATVWLDHDRDGPAPHEADCVVHSLGDLLGVVAT